MPQPWPEQADALQAILEGLALGSQRQFELRLSDTQATSMLTFGRTELALAQPRVRFQADGVCLQGRWVILGPWQFAVTARGVLSARQGRPRLELSHAHVGRLTLGGRARSALGASLLDALWLPPGVRIVQLETAPGELIVRGQITR
jgi:hypothetical protein